MSKFVWQPALPSPSPNLRECTPNELRCAHSASAIVEGHTHGALRLSSRVAEREECTDGIVGRRTFAPPYAAGRNNLHVIELVREIEYELLRLFPAHAGHTLQRGDVFLANSAHQPVGRQRREHAEGERRSYTLRVEHAAKNLSLEGAG